MFTTIAVARSPSPGSRSLSRVHTRPRAPISGTPAPQFLAPAPHFLAPAPQFLALRPNFWRSGPYFRPAQSSDKSDCTVPPQTMEQHMSDQHELNPAPHAVAHVQNPGAPALGEFTLPILQHRDSEIEKQTRWNSAHTNPALLGFAPPSSRLIQENINRPNMLFDVLFQWASGCLSGYIKHPTLWHPNMGIASSPEPHVRAHGWPICQAHIHRPFCTAVKCHQRFLTRATDKRGLHTLYRYCV